MLGVMWKNYIPIASVTVVRDSVITFVSMVSQHYYGFLSPLIKTYIGLF